MTDPKSVLYFFMALAVILGVIFGITAITIWLRGVGQRMRISKQKQVAEVNDNAKKPTMPEILFGGGTVYDLKPGQRYTVKQHFADFYNGEFEVGETLTFVKKDYLPYHGGHTITFAERTMYFQDEANANILQSLWDYLEPGKYN